MLKDIVEWFVWKKTYNELYTRDDRKTEGLFSTENSTNAYNNALSSTKISIVMVKSKMQGNMILSKGNK